MPLVDRLFRDAYLDLGRMEAALEASGAAWTVVRPPQLADEHREPMRAFVASRVRTPPRAFDRLSPERREGFAAGLEAWARELHGI
jgi:uncharacterized protein YbjT (DUF2867 family)